MPAELELIMAGTTTMTASNVIANNIRTYFEIHRAFQECDAETREIVDQMLTIYNDPEADDHERQRAVNTVVDALFPSLSAELMDGEVRVQSAPEMVLAKADLDLQGSIFADRLASILQQRGWTVDTLADRTGISAAIVTRMIAKQCRPERRTVERIAAILEVIPGELWPDFSLTPES